jgi:16S rRNA (uracil1498-N3)-methyltransferase
MKHTFRFFGQRLGECSWHLSQDEWHHVVRVLRLSEGDKIEVSDGKGWVCSAILGALNKTGGQLIVKDESYTEKCLRNEELTIGLGVLKPQSIDEVLPGLVELGVNRLILVPFQGMDKTRLSEKLLERWERQIIAASKQAKAPWFLELVIAGSFDDFLVLTREYTSRFLLDPSGDILFPRVGLPIGPHLTVVGSEAGWSPGEISRLLDAGFERLRIESNVLRATTAVLATAAIFRQGLATIKRT